MPACRSTRRSARSSCATRSERPMPASGSSGALHASISLDMAAGYTHHIAVPVVLPNGMHNGFTFATRAPNGFSDEDIAVLRSIVPTLAALQEVLALQRVMREVMRMYVGDEPHLRILSGDVRRARVPPIRAFTLFSQ